MRATATSILAIVALASAGNVYVDNLCPFYAWLTTDQQPFETPYELNSQTYTAATVPQLGPDAIPHNINIALDPNMTTPFAFTYSQNNFDGNNYYSFNTTTGDPLSARGFEVLTNGMNPPNPAVRCEARPGGGCCQHAFTYAGETATVGINLFYTNNGADFTLRLCRYTDA